MLLKERSGILSTVGIMTYTDTSDRFPGALMEAKLPERHQVGVRGSERSLLD